MHCRQQINTRLTHPLYWTTGPHPHLVTSSGLSSTTGGSGRGGKLAAAAPAPTAAALAAPPPTRTTAWRCICSCCAKREGTLSPSALPPAAAAAEAAASAPWLPSFTPPLLPNSTPPPPLVPPSAPACFCCTSRANCPTCGAKGRPGRVRCRPIHFCHRAELYDADLLNAACCGATCCSRLPTLYQPYQWQATTSPSHPPLAPPWLGPAPPPAALPPRRHRRLLHAGAGRSPPASVWLAHSSGYWGHCAARKQSWGRTRASCILVGPRTCASAMRLCSSRPSPIRTSSTTVCRQWGRGAGKVRCRCGSPLPPGHGIILIAAPSTHDRCCWAPVRPGQPPGGSQVGEAASTPWTGAHGKHCVL